MATVSIKNRKTGVIKVVTPREWEVIQGNPLVAKAWTIITNKESEGISVPASKQKESKVISVSK